MTKMHSIYFELPTQKIFDFIIHVQIIHHWYRYIIIIIIITVIRCKFIRVYLFKIFYSIQSNSQVN